MAYFDRLPKRVKYKPLAIAKIFSKFNQTKFASNKNRGEYFEWM